MLCRMSLKSTFHRVITFQSLNGCKIGWLSCLLVRFGCSIITLTVWKLPRFSQARVIGCDFIIMATITFAWGFMSATVSTLPHILRGYIIAEKTWVFSIIINCLWLSPTKGIGRLSWDSSAIID